MEDILRKYKLESATYSGSYGSFGESEEVVDLYQACFANLEFTNTLQAVLS